MNFIEAVKSYFVNIINYKGRASRSEFWWAALFAFLLYSFAIAIDVFLNLQNPSLTEATTTATVSNIVYIILFVPYISLAVRRLHDTGKSGWWFLLNFAFGIGAIVLLVLLALDSQPQPNKWGLPVNSAQQGYYPNQQQNPYGQQMPYGNVQQQPYGGYPQQQAPAPRQTGFPQQPQAHQQPQQAPQQPQPFNPYGQAPQPPQQVSGQGNPNWAPPPVNPPQPNNFNKNPYTGQ